MKNKIDPKYIGVPNICFSLTEKNDKREKKYSKQRIKFGFDESETWSLSDTIAKFIIPRLEKFIELDICLRDEKEKKFMKQSLKAFKLIVRDNGARSYSEKEWKQIEKGLKSFSKIFMGLWW